MSTKLHCHYSHGQTILKCSQHSDQKMVWPCDTSYCRLTWAGFDGLAVSCPKGLGLGSELHLDPLLSYLVSYSDVIESQ